MSKRDTLGDALDSLPFGFGTVAKLLSPEVWLADKVLDLMEGDERKPSPRRAESDD